MLCGLIVNPKYRNNTLLRNSVNIYQTIRRHIAQDITLYSLLREQQITCFLVIKFSPFEKIRRKFNNIIITTKTVNLPPMKSLDGT